MMDVPLSGEECGSNNDTALEDAKRIFIEFAQKEILSKGSSISSASIRSTPELPFLKD